MEISELKLTIKDTNNIIYPKGEINGVNWSNYFTLVNQDNNNVSLDKVDLVLSSNNGKAYAYFEKNGIKSNAETIYLYYEVNSIESFLSIDEDLSAWYAQTQDIYLHDVNVGSHYAIMSVARSVVADGDSYRLTEDKVFTGVFDGNGYQFMDFSDIYKDIDNNMDYCYAQSLFGIVGVGGVLRNITIELFNVHSRNLTGLLVSENRGEIYNIKISNSTILNRYNNGGFIAATNSGLISNVFISCCTYIKGAANDNTNILLRNNTNGSINSILIYTFSYFDGEHSPNSQEDWSSLYLVDDNRMGTIHNVNGSNTNSNLNDLDYVGMDEVYDFGVFNDCWQVYFDNPYIKNVLDYKMELNLYDFIAQERVWGYKDTQTHGGVIRDNVVRKDDGTIDIIVNGSYYEGDKLGVNSSYSDVYGGKKTGADLKSKEAYSYGTFEVVMTVPSFNGICTSIWLYNNFTNELGGDNHNYEIDIEIHGSVIEEGALLPKNLSGILCSSWLTEKIYESVFRSVGRNLADGKYHKFTIEWTPEYIKYYVDDVLYETQTGHIPTNKMYLNIGAWFPNGWCGEANFESDLFSVKSFKYTPYVGTASIGERESDTIVSNTMIRPWIKTIEKNLIANPTFDTTRTNMVWVLSEGSTLESNALNGTITQIVEMDAYDTDYVLDVTYKGSAKITVYYESLVDGVITEEYSSSVDANHTSMSKESLVLEPVDNTTKLRVVIESVDGSTQLQKIKLTIKES